MPTAYCVRTEGFSVDVESDPPLRVVRAFVTHASGATIYGAEGTLDGFRAFVTDCVPNVLVPLCPADHMQDFQAEMRQVLLAVEEEFGKEGE
jgi:hypothetical protein